MTRYPNLQIPNYKPTSQTFLLFYKEISFYYKNVFRPIQFRKKFIGSFDTFYNNLKKNIDEKVLLKSKYQIFNLFFIIIIIF